MTKCNIHEFFFDWNCNDCKEEYKNLKGTNKIDEESHEDEVEPKKTKTKKRSLKISQKNTKTFCVAK